MWLTSLLGGRGKGGGLEKDGWREGQEREMCV